MQAQGYIAAGQHTGIYKNIYFHKCIHTLNIQYSQSFFLKSKVASFGLVFIDLCLFHSWNLAKLAVNQQVSQSLL